jgi:hypothetical protein
LESEVSNRFVEDAPETIDLSDVCFVFSKIGGERLIEQFNTDILAEEDFVSLGQVENTVGVVLSLQKFVTVEYKHLVSRVSTVTAQGERLRAVSEQAANYRIRHRLRDVFEVRSAVVDVLAAARRAAYGDVFVRCPHIRSLRNAGHC